MTMNKRYESPKHFDCLLHVRADAVMHSKYCWYQYKHKRLLKTREIWVIDFSSLGKARANQPNACILKHSKYFRKIAGCLLQNQPARLAVGQS